MNNAKLTVALLILVGVANLSFASILIERENLRRSTTQTTLYDIVPILTCVDRNNKAYFTYDNRAGAQQTIAFSEFNSLTPLNVAPMTSFVNGSGPSFPLGSVISLAGFESANFNWNLQEYYLPFTITPALACPPKFNITMKFIFTWDDDANFPTAADVVAAFSSLAGIPTTRFKILQDDNSGPPSKRDIMVLAALDVILELNDGNATNTTDPTAADIIREFIENQKQKELNQAIQHQYNYPSNMTIFDPKSSDPQPIVGQVRPPSATPVSVPTAQPSSAPKSPVSGPTSAAPTSTPKPSLVASSTTLVINAFLTAVLIALGL